MCIGQIGATVFNRLFFSCRHFLLRELTQVFSMHCLFNVVFHFGNSSICISFRFSMFQVIPSLQGLGIGRMIVKRIIRYMLNHALQNCHYFNFSIWHLTLLVSARVLTSGGIFDIAALCSEKERCGSIYAYKFKYLTCALSWLNTMSRTKLSYQ